MHSAYGTRLLSIGEIFDRAVHISVANFLTLATIVGLVAVPVRAIGDWLDREALNRVFSADGNIVADPTLLASYFTLIRDPHAHPYNWSPLLWTFASLLPLSLAIAAASIASQDFLNGERPRLGPAYRTAVERLGPVIGAWVLASAMYVAVILAVVIAVFVFWFVWLLIVKAGGGATAGELAVGIPAMFIIVGAAAIMWIIPPTYCITTGAALYAMRPFQALRKAWAMTTVRGLRGRSFAFGAALLALDFVLEIFRLVVCGLVSDVTHSLWLSYLASDGLTLLALIFSMALAVVFYLDARNRVGLFQDPLAEHENSQAR